MVDTAEQPPTNEQYKSTANEWLQDKQQQSSEKLLGCRQHNVGLLLSCQLLQDKANRQKLRFHYFQALFALHLLEATVRSHLQLIRTSTLTTGRVIAHQIEIQPSRFQINSNKFHFGKGTLGFSTRANNEAAFFPLKILSHETFINLRINFFALVYERDH